MHRSWEKDFKNSDRLLQSVLGNGNSGGTLPITDLFEARHSATDFLVLQNWEKDPDLTVGGLRTIGTLACLPSLEAIAESRPHDRSVAVQVNENIAQATSDILSSPYVMSRGRDDRKDIVGGLSEIAVLGALWWSIAKGLRDEKTYVLPTTLSVDCQKNVGQLKTGQDLVMKRSGSKERHPIQVKTKLSDNGQYYVPGIAILSPEFNKWDKTAAPTPFGLLRALTRQKASRNTLTRWNRDADKRIQKASRMSKIYNRRT